MITNKIRRRHVDYTWPGFVDALSSLLMVIIFVLMIFVLSQFFLSQKMSGQDEALVKLKTNLIELSELLSLERQSNTALTSHLSILETKIISLREKFEKEQIINDKNYKELERNLKIINFNENKIKELEITLNKKIQEAMSSKSNIIDLSKSLEKKQSKIEKKNALLKVSEEEVNKLTRASIL